MRFLNPTSWSNPVWAIVILGAAALWMGSGLLREAKSEQTGHQEHLLPQRVITQLLSPKNIPLPRIFSGVTQATQSINLPAQTPGQVRSFKIEEGKRVEQGTIIAELDPSTRENALKSAQAGELKARHDVRVAEGLLQKGLGSAAAVEIAKAALAEAENAVALAQKDLEYTQLKAPFSGVFEKRLVDSGAYVAMGEGLATFVQMDPLKVVFSVPESEIVGVEPGQKAILNFPNFEGYSGIEGIVTRVGGVATGQTRTFEVVVSVPNPAGQLKAGVSAKGVIQTRPQPLIEIPIQAIVLTTQGDPAIRFVEEGKVREKILSTLSLTETSAWISGEGPPLEIIVQGQGLVTEGSPVITETASSAPITDHPSSSP